MKNTILLSAVLALLSREQAPATVIADHQGAADPLTESFQYWPFNGGITTAPLANDLGQPAWQIASTGSSDEQALYNQSGGLTPAQINAINAEGYTMSLQARIVSGPNYNSGGLYSVSVSVAGFNGVRYDIELGSDGLGNTLVVLPTDVSYDGSVSFRSTPFGSPLVISGVGYHLYQLSYDPIANSAALFVDGVESVTGYQGSTVAGGAVNNNYGLGFGSTNDATGNYAHAELDSGQLVPEPSASVLLGWSAIAGFGVWRWKRRHHAGTGARRTP